MCYPIAHTPATIVCPRQSLLPHDKIRPPYATMPTQGPRALPVLWMLKRSSSKWLLRLGPSTLKVHTRQTTALALAQQPTRLMRGFYKRRNPRYGKEKKAQL